MSSQAIIYRMSTVRYTPITHQHGPPIHIGYCYDYFPCTTLRTLCKVSACYASILYATQRDITLQTKKIKMTLPVRSTTKSLVEEACWFAGYVHGPMLL